MPQSAPYSLTRGSPEVGQLDPVTKKRLTEGDRVVKCPRGHIYLETSWEFLGHKCTLCPVEPGKPPVPPKPPWPRGQAGPLITLVGIASIALVAIGAIVASVLLRPSPPPATLVVPENPQVTQPPPSAGNQANPPASGDGPAAAVRSGPIPIAQHNSDWQPAIHSFDGVQMALVPPGCFEMGSSMGDSDELPVNQQCFDTPFWIDQGAVTRIQFGLSRTDTSPATGMTWSDALIYCQSRGGRLPTERDWEYAARGPDNLQYPSGNGLSGGTGPSWVGAVNMVGGVQEWTSSLYANYPWRPDDGRESATAGDKRIIRGGPSLIDTRGDFSLRATYREWRDRRYGANNIGVRCVRDYAK